MNPRFLALSILCAMPLQAQTCDCCKADIKPTAATSQDAARHPLKGVIVDILPERSALLVKHEEIPGVMKAMTMMLKVDADTLKSAQKGQAITGQLVRKADGWWLENVAPATDK